jgi:hypothetical protein
MELVVPEMIVQGVNLDLGGQPVRPVGIEHREQLPAGQS